MIAPDGVGMQKEYRTFQHWPWEEEDISTEEYIRSLQGLIHFLKDVDVSAIHTLEDVSAVASLVGHDLHTIVVIKGMKIEKKTEKLEPGASEPISHIEREYVLTHYAGNREVIVTTGNGHVSISERGIVGFQR